METATEVKPEKPGADGPTARVTLRCDDCRHERSTPYRVQGDSGQDVYCCHPALPAPKCIGDTTWATPQWCPVVVAALAETEAGAAAVGAALPKDLE